MAPVAPQTVSPTSSKKKMGRSTPHGKVNVPAPAVFRKLELAPAYRQVADSVERMITSGRLAPGDWLPTETDLATQLGVNRSTVHIDGLVLRPSVWLSR